ncbi:prolyl oligopeptidase family serine peptidase [Demequina sp. B12]|nr:prolyl oligopeptidase family serine peptidase [Demequina sp. B12]MDE0571856.1 prolyl oligopeptidase family serine peptidase [Demequina sp. B12]
MPRLEGAALSPDGTRVVLTVASLSQDGTTYERSLWEVPATGEGVPVRLTRSAKGEGGAQFLSNGDLLFSSSRPGAGDDEKPQLWILPTAGGEARPVSALAGGAGGLSAVAADAPVALFSAGVMPAADTWENDAALRATRDKRSVAAILHDSYPIRHWDHDLGPDHTHICAIDLAGLAPEVPGHAKPAQASAPTEDAEPRPYPAHLPRPTDLTPAAMRWVTAPAAALTPDGTVAVVSYPVANGRSSYATLVTVEVATGELTVLRDEVAVDFEAPAVSPDASLIAYTRNVKATPDGPTHVEMWVSALDGSDARQVASAWDRWPSSLQFSADGASLIVTADDNGRAPIFRVDLADDSVTALTTDDYAYMAVQVDRHSGALVALRSNWLRPAHPVRIDVDSDGATVTELSTPAPAVAANVTMTDVECEAEDGTRVRGWLLTPPDASEASPAPLLLWIHGGPLGSWNAWSWRWSPALAVARGYAVLLPDPALSTGYGMEFIARGWNSWGHKPFTDLMTITDAVEARPEIDETRTAAMGGSFGGYMANWVAGHTDRFNAVVTHASLWALDQFGPTTDHADYWQSIFTPESMVEHSPHRAVADITSPMLVIHGDKDYRVPVGEGLRLWAELAEHFAAPDGSMPHRFLYFPNENHWILTPQHAVVWYEAVFHFLAQHVLGEVQEIPEALKISGAGR